MAEFGAVSGHSGRVGSGWGLGVAGTTEIGGARTRLNHCLKLGAELRWLAAYGWRRLPNRMSTAMGAQLRHRTDGATKASLGQGCPTRQSLEEAALTVQTVMTGLTGWPHGHPVRAQRRLGETASSPSSVAQRATAATLRRLVTPRATLGSSRAMRGPSAMQPSGTSSGVGWNCGGPATDREARA